jgi:hypothetical protein
MIVTFLARKKLEKIGKFAMALTIAVLIGSTLMATAALADTCGSKTSNTEGFQCYNTKTDTDKFVEQSCLPTLCMGQGTDVFCCKTKTAESPTPTTSPTPAGGSGATPPATSLDNSGCPVPGTDFKFPCPLGERGVNQIIGNLIKWVLGVVGGLFLVMFVYGGFQYIISGANSKNAELGKKTLINAVIGITIVIGAYILVDALAKLFKLGLS